MRHAWVRIRFHPSRPYQVTFLPCRTNRMPARLRDPATSLYPLQVALRQVAAGAAHWLALSMHGEVFSCGNGDSGQLGQGTRESMFERPAPIITLVGKEQVPLSFGLSTSSLSYLRGPSPFSSRALRLLCPPLHLSNAGRCTGYLAALPRDGPGYVSYTALWAYGARFRSLQAGEQERWSV